MKHGPDIFRGGYDGARELLRSYALRVSPKIQEHLSIWEMLFPNSTEALKAQYTDWLLYSDGRRHLSLRSATQTVLNSNANECLALADRHIEWFVQTVRKQGNIRLSTVTSLTSRLHRTILNLSLKDYARFAKLCRLVGDFMTCGKMNAGLTPVDLNNYVHEIGFLIPRLPSESLVGKLTNAGLPLGTVINIVGDTFTPIHSAIASTLSTMVIEQASLAEFLPENASEFVAEVLRLHPPFVFCSRSEKKAFSATAGTTRRLLIDLKHANLDEQKFCNANRLMLRESKGSLSFGHGLHSCLGAHISTQLLRKLVVEVHSSRLLGQAVIQKLRVSDSSGVRRYSALNISIQ